MKKFFVTALATWISVTAAPAAFWKCEMPGGTYTVNLATVSSVSTHEYLVGPMRVTELTIATTGSVVTRFYYIEPYATKSPIGLGQSVIDKAQEKVDELGSRLQQAGIDPPWKKVVKDYPLATHAHTVEYRVGKLEQLEKLRASIEAAWHANADSSIKISSGSGQ